MRLLFEVHGVREQRRADEVNVVGPMGFTCCPHDAAEMRRLSPLAGELGAIALGGRPLVAEHIGSRRLPIGREQIDKSQRQKRPLPQRSEEHTSELQSLAYLVCRLLLEKKKNSLGRFSETYERLPFYLLTQILKVK